MFSESDKNRYFAKVDVRGPDECWPWLAAVHPQSGYGIFGVRNHRPVCRTHGWHREHTRKIDPGKDVFHTWIAHRHGWEIENGPLPPDKIICHTCDNRLCQNPKHWELADQHKNMADMRARGRAADHSGELNGRAKLTAKQVAFIRAALLPQVSAKNLTLTAIARMYDVSVGLICAIRKGRVWADKPEQDEDDEGYRDQTRDRAEVVGARMWAGNCDPF